MGKDFEYSSFLFGSNSVFIEELYQKYLQDPAEIAQSYNFLAIRFLHYFAIQKVGLLKILLHFSVEEVMGQALT